MPLPESGFRARVASHPLSALSISLSLYLPLPSPSPSLSLSPSQTYSDIQLTENACLSACLLEYQPINIFSPHALGLINKGDDGVIYARSIAPLSEMGVTAFVWYQGESNSGYPGIVMRCRLQGAGCRGKGAECRV